MVDKLILFVAASNNCHHIMLCPDEIQQPRYRMSCISNVRNRVKYRMSCISNVRNRAKYEIVRIGENERLQ